MTVDEIIEELMKIPADLRKTLPVCVADWSEEYGEPNGDAAARVSVQAGMHVLEKEFHDGQFVQIG